MLTGNILYRRHLLNSWIPSPEDDNKKSEFVALPGVRNSQAGGHKNSEAAHRNLQSQGL